MKTKTGRLNIKNIKTIKQLNSTDWKKYSDTSYQDPNYYWIRYIKYPVSSESLNSICKLSEEKEANIKLYWRMGELYMTKGG